MTVKLIVHPEHFKTGTRVLMLKGRHKDGITHERTVTKVTREISHFNRVLREMLDSLEPGERIYGTAGERNVPRAIRLFKERQLQADYDDNPSRFYERLNDRWVSCVMNPVAQKEKFWLFDCDSAFDTMNVRRDLKEHYDGKAVPHIYQSKSGTHFVVSPFNRSLLSPVAQSTLHDNAIILWAY